MTEPTPDRIMQTGMGFWASKALLTAVELELFTELAQQPDDAEGLRRRLGLHPRAARDFLDALTALGFLQREGGRYRNTAETDRYLDKRKATYIGGMLEMANHRLYRFWGGLTEALKTGEPQNEAKGGGEDFFSTLYADPDRLEEFLSSMSGLSRGANRRIAELFPWSEYGSFVDVGAAQGDLVAQVCEAHPHLSGVGFDLPQARPVFDRYIEQRGLADRVRFVEGDFFRNALPRTEVVVMGHILHDWDLEQKKQLIRSAYEAVPEGGALIAYDAIIDDERETNAFGLLMSLNMLIETPGGFDYTGADCQGWMREIGFRETRVEHLIGPDSMVVGIK